MKLCKSCFMHPERSDHCDCKKHSVSASGSNELLCGEDKIKDIATEFYYHWHNLGGTNTADGFDSWWKLNKRRFGFAT